MIKSWNFGVLLFAFLACGRSSTQASVLFPVDTTSTCKNKPVCQSFPARFTTRGAESNGVTLHWDFATCLPVTYDPALEAQKDLILHAMAVWSGESCSRVCFAGLSSENTLPQGDERRIHFTTSQRGTQTVAPGYKLLSNANFCGPNGLMMQAVGMIDDQQLSSVTKADFVHLLGYALGAESKASDSVLAPTSTPTQATLSLADRQFLCEFYGTTPFCK